ncbi:hypothetical protein U9M48_000642 [Paspalum notatum var. saurae]|uniref:TTF-type domain-containing protein n=1 Tax=Paspalum notatum var. saurae TaxID=547442 RepID=A0AAQ3PE57_PASNO
MYSSKPSPTKITLEGNEACAASSRSLPSGAASRLWTPPDRPSALPLRSPVGLRLSGLRPPRLAGSAVRPSALPAWACRAPVPACRACRAACLPARLRLRAAALPPAWRRPPRPAPRPAAALAPRASSRRAWQQCTAYCPLLPTAIEKGKTVASSAPPIPDLDEELCLPPIVEDEEQALPSHSIEDEVPNEEEEEEEEDNNDSTPVYDVDCLEHDPGLRVPISRFDVNDQDAVRRGYILKGPCHLYAHDYPVREIYGHPRRFSIIWFSKYPWIEYSVEKDAAFCFICYLFGNETGTWVTNGGRNWNVGSSALDKHSGSTVHKFAQDKYNLFVKKGTKIDTVIVKVSEKDRVEYKARLTYSLRCLRHIVEELGEDYFAILADESSDISHGEQLVVCLRYVDKLGRVCERFLGVIHVSGTTSLQLKTAIQSLLASHHLTLTQIRGQGYDGASNIKGEVKGLKTLIIKESSSAYYVHCFAHQLQSVLVAIAKGDVGCQTFFGQVSCLLNIVGVSCKRHDMLRDVRARQLKKALQLGEIESSSGLNQEMGLARPGETRWGSHYKTILHIMYSTIMEVLVTLGNDPTQRDDWPNIHAMTHCLESFEFAFNAHLMLVILGYTNELCLSLQKRDQDIVNAMSLVGVAKKRMQKMRSDGWEGFFEKVKLFCIKHSIDAPPLDGKYEPHGRSLRYYPVQTIDDHYRREVYIGVIDRIHHELENRFDEVSMELLLCVCVGGLHNDQNCMEKVYRSFLAAFHWLRSTPELLPLYPLYD